MVAASRERTARTMIRQPWPRPRARCRCSFPRSLAPWLHAFDTTRKSSERPTPSRLKLSARSSSNTKDAWHGRSQHCSCGIRGQRTARLAIALGSACVDRAASTRDARQWRIRPVPVAPILPAWASSALHLPRVQRHDDRGQRTDPSRTRGGARAQSGALACQGSAVRGGLLAARRRGSNHRDCAGIEPGIVTIRMPTDEGEHAPRPEPGQPAPRPEPAPNSPFAPSPPRPAVPEYDEKGIKPDKIEYR